MSGAEALQAQIEFVVALDATGAPPSEFRIFKAGQIQTTKGIFAFTESSAESVMEKFTEHGADMPIDYCHAMLISGFGGDPAEQGAAAGWFKPMVKDGELWASDVTWTPRGAQKLKDREFRYISPTFNRKEDGEITELVNVALTNLPATKGLSPLVAQRDTDSKEEPQTMKTVIAALSLKTESTEAEALSAVSALVATESKVLEMTGAKTSTEALATIHAWKDGAAKVEALSAELGTVKAEKLKAEVASLIEEGVKAGKISPAQVELMGEHAPEYLKRYLATAPVVKPGASAQLEKPTDGGIVALSDEEKAYVAKAFGRNDFDALAKKRKELKEAGLIAGQ